MNWISKYLPTIAIVIAVVAIASATYEHFLSNEKQLERALRNQIRQHEETIVTLQATFRQLHEADQQRLREIMQLKERLTALRQNIDTGEVTIANIKNGVTEIDEALEIIAQRTRAVVDRTRSVLDTDGARTGGRQRRAATAP